MTTREKIIEVVNRLFIYTDSQNWSALQNEVFTDRVFLDMSSMGGNASEVSARQICETWKVGFEQLDAVHHLGGNYLVDLVSEEEAKVLAYATATHYKKSARNGTTRDFVGTYYLKLRQIGDDWKIHSFVYNLKYATGNLELE